MSLAPEWRGQLDSWLAPFLDVLGDRRRRQWAPLYVLGLLLPGERKSIEPLSGRVAPEELQQLHHFVSASNWDVAPLEEVLCRKVDRMLGGSDAFLIVDDTSLPKKGKASVGVAHQYCGALGKQANCQSLVSLTLARNDTPTPVALRLFLPEEWSKDRVRCKRVGVPSDLPHKTKPRIALEEIDRVRASGLQFGCVLADAGYGAGAEFRRGLSERGLAWAVGILSTHNMYPADVEVWMPKRSGPGMPRLHPKVDKAPQSAQDFIQKNGRFRKVPWRQGTKGELSGEFALVRVRPADGKEVSNGAHLPGDVAWLVCERFTNGEQKYYLANLPESASAKSIVSAIKARWACEQMHQQAKEELGLDHFEGRSWLGLHHHALLTMIAFAFLTQLRLSENK